MVTDGPRLILSVADQGSSVWRSLVQHYESKLDSLRRKNDGRMSEVDRHVLLGRIEEIKALLDIAKPLPVVQAVHQ